MQPLRGAEHLAPKRMGDHDVVAKLRRRTRDALLFSWLWRQDSGSAGTSRIAGRARMFGSSAGRSAKATRRRDQRIERGVAQQAERRGQAAAVGPARPVRGRDLADLARDRAAGGGCGTPRRAAAATSPAPYQLSSTTVRLVAGEPQRGGEPGGAALAWTTRSQSAGAASRRGEGRRRGRPRSRRARGSMSTSVTSAPGSSAHSHAHQEPTTPPPTTAMRSAGPGAASHTALSAVSMLAASTARAAGTPVGSGAAASAGTIERGLMGMERKADAADESGRPGLDAADGRVAVFHRKRKGSRHERRAHALECSLAGTRPLSTSALGAAADPAVKRVSGAPRRRRAAPPFRSRISTRPGPTYHSASPCSARSPTGSTSHWPLKCLSRYISPPNSFQAIYWLSPSRLHDVLPYGTGPGAGVARVDDEAGAVGEAHVVDGVVVGDDQHGVVARRPPAGSSGTDSRPASRGARASSG